MDHHCPFLGSCVGRGNYPAFLIMVSSITLAVTPSLFWSFWLLGWQIATAHEHVFGFVLAGVRFLTPCPTELFLFRLCA
eukprot:SAG31_NODE_30_length_32545_cov_9.378999_37_plen_79_part_00